MAETEEEGSGEGKKVKNSMKKSTFSSCMAILARHVCLRARFQPHACNVPVEGDCAVWTCMEDTKIPFSPPQKKKKEGANLPIIACDAIESCAAWSSRDTLVALRALWPLGLRINAIEEEGWVNRKALTAVTTVTTVDANPVYVCSHNRIVAAVLANACVFE